MANNAAHDTRTTLPGNRLAQAVGLNVAARVQPSGLLARIDFAAGDTQETPSVNDIGFSMSGSRPISAAPNGDLGMIFPYSGSLKGDSWYEQSWDIRPQGLFENYERFNLWIPANFEHRALVLINLSSGEDISSWVYGDIVGNGDGTSQKGIYTGTYQNADGDWAVVKHPQNRNYSSWAGTLTNITRSVSVSTVSRTWSSNNNKFSAQWADGYGGNNSIIEYQSDSRDSDPIGPTDSEFTAQSYQPTGVTEDGETTGQRYSAEFAGRQPGIEASDFGALHEFVIRRRRSSSKAAKDGIVQIWKDGVKVYELLNSPLYSATNNKFEEGYIMGYSNSGFDEDTTFYVTLFELYGDTPPPGITP